MKKEAISCGRKVGYFTETEVLLISNKCKQLVEKLNKIIKGLSTNSQPKPKPQPQPLT